MRHSSAASRPTRAATRAAAAAAIAALATLVSLGVAAPDDAAALAPRQPAADDPAIGDLADRALETLDDAGAARNLAMHSQYSVERDVVATLAAEALGLDHKAMRAAWARADLVHQRALLSAVTQLGVPYQSMASIENTAFDCSGLTLYAWSRAGVGLSRSSGSQIAAASSRTRDTAMAGDLMQYPGHVMMYLGVDNAIVHSPYSGRNVELGFVRSDRSVSFGNPIG